jgi:O-antigen/teichoic acid export membrane protein
MKKNFFYTVLLSVVNILFPILSFPYASHILGPLGIGKVQLVVSFAQYFALFAALGIPIYGIRETARHRDDPVKLSAVFTELTVIYFIASLVLFFVYLGVIYTFPFFEEGRTMYLYAGILIFLSFSYTDWFYTGLEQFRGITIRSVIVKALSLLLLYLFVKTENDFINYLMIVIFSILGNQLLSFFMIFRKTYFNFSNLGFKKHIQPVLYIFSASIAASIYTVLDTVLLGFLSTTKAVGLYTAAVKLIRVTFPFIVSMSTILMPRISKSFSENDLTEVKKLHATSLQFLTFFCLPVCAGIVILAPELIFIFSGEQFLQATLSMQILSLLPVLIGLGNFFQFQVLIPSGRNKEVFFSMLAGMVTCLILNFSLVPILAETGSAIATVFTELAVTISYFLFVRKFYSCSYNWKLFFQSIVGSLLFFPLVTLIRTGDFGVIGILLLSIASCTTLYITIHLFVFKNVFLLNFIKPFLNRFRVNKDISHE